jgi:hypothetical protein
MKLFGYTFFEKVQAAPKAVDDRPKTVALPAGRTSQPTPSNNSMLDLQGQYQIVTPQFLTELIPLIRKLAYWNEDVSQAVHNIVSLGNTGHKIFFDRRVPTEQVDLMRNHLINKRKNWAPGQAGIDGLVNKMFAQVLISGALSIEYPPNNVLTGLKGGFLVNPETVVFKLMPDKVTYRPYQKVVNSMDKRVQDGLVPLNTNTYQYFALNGDEELPYGIPPYLPVIAKIQTQAHMNKNIEFITDIVGLVGFLEVLMDKPDQKDGESDPAYQTRLQNLITAAKQNVIGGIKDGVVVGYNGDHTFKFNSASKAFEQVVELYKNNELQVASALKQDASLWGRDYSTSEATLGIVFMKMISELRNIQNIIATSLEYAYSLELRLAGFNFDYLKVQFNRSTIQDDLKYQQAEEIKVRNVKDKRLMGIIDQDQAADELGYEAPASADAIVDWEIIAGSSSTEDPGLATDAKKKKQDRKAGKNKSARTGRRKAKPNPKDDKK